MQANYEKAGKTATVGYVNVVQAITDFEANKLSVKNTTRFIIQAAKERRFLSYANIAKENKAVWSKVKYAMPKHLIEVSAQAHARGWPMLTAIVVNEKNTATGKLDEESLSDFSKCAKDLGYEVTDETEFLKAQQAAVFEVAERGELT